MPLTTWAATRAGSAPRVPEKELPSAIVRSAKPYFDTIMNSAAPQQTMIWVRMPASLKRLLRSKPMAEPKRHASSSRRHRSITCAGLNCVCRA